MQTFTFFNSRAAFMTWF